jgi:hypothetical protein
MPIVLAGASSGQTTIQATDATTQTITLPAQTGTVMVNGPAFSAYANATQSLTSNVVTKVAINTKLFDTNNNFDATTNYRFTPTVAGYYQVNGSVYFTATANATQVLAILYKNGANWLWGNNSAMTDLATTQIVSTVMYLNGSTDYIELYAYSYQGTSVVINNASNAYISSNFSAALVRSA